MPDDGGSFGRNDLTVAPSLSSVFDDFSARERALFDAGELHVLELPPDVWERYAAVRGAACSAEYGNGRCFAVPSEHADHLADVDDALTIVG